MKYEFEYTLIREITDDENIVNLPVSEFSYKKLKNLETDDYNEALQWRCILCRIFQYGYVRIVEK